MRTFGALGALGGLLLVAAFVVEIGPEANFFRLILFNVGAIAIVAGIYVRERSPSRLLAPVATAAAVLANAWYLLMILLSIGRPVFPEPDPTFRPIFAIAANPLWLADAVYGLVAWRMGLGSRIAGLVLGLGALLAGAGNPALGLTNGPLKDLIGPASLVGIGLVSVGWILFGITLATRRKAQSQTGLNDSND